MYGLPDVPPDPPPGLGRSSFRVRLYRLPSIASVSYTHLDVYKRQLDKYTLGKNLTLADTEYKYSKNIAFSFGSETSMTTKSDYVIYLDTNGMVIYVDEHCLLYTSRCV